MKQFSNLNEEIQRMTSLAGVKITDNINKKQVIISEMSPEQKEILNENLLINEETDDIFAGTGDEEENKKIETGGAKVEMPTELKVAMIMNNIDDYTASLFNAYTKYIPRTKGATGGEEGTLQAKPSVEKIKGSEFEIRRLAKDFRRPVTWSPEGWKSQELSKFEKEQTAKWLSAGKKDDSIISYRNGLTPLGKAQLEFLARMVAQNPGNHEDEKAFLESTYKNHFSVVAEEILRRFYTKVLIPYIVILTKRAKYTTNDLQIHDFIENGIEHALEQLRAGKYDISRGNVGAWLIQIVKNEVIKNLEKISDYKLDVSEASHYLGALSESGQPFKAKSKANPSEVEGSYDEVKDLGNGVWLYIYNDPLNALSDLQHDARKEKGTKSSPLTPRFLVDKGIFYKSIPKNIAGAEGFGLEQTVEPEEVLKLNTLPIEAKANVLGILNTATNEILGVEPKISRKAYGAGLGRDIFNNFLFTLLQYGKDFLILNKPFEYMSPISGKKMVYPVTDNEGNYRRVELDDQDRLMIFDKEAGKKVPVMASKEGEIPDVRFKWLAPAHDVLEGIISKFNEDTLNKFANLPDNKNKDIKQLQDELANNGFIIPYDKALIIRRGLNDYLKKNAVAYEEIKDNIESAVLAESKRKALNHVRNLIREILSENQK